MTTAISIKGVSKQYVLGSELVAGQNFREMLMSSLISPFRKIRRLRGEDHQQEKFWALSDVTFDVQAGEVVGIIGLNGAGKSTLLKVLSRITTPTQGEIEYQGRLASLLEVGTGFHPELTGRENIYLNGAILGMTRQEINIKIDEIVAFAEIDRFLDTPVKRYSSGMYVRLAFSVAAHLDPEILIVDEVLSVGDAKFQSKCIGKMKNVAEQGRTVIFISHNLAAVSRLCDRGIWLEKGSIKMDGNIHDVIGEYENHSLQGMKSSSDSVISNSAITIEDIVIRNDSNPDHSTLSLSSSCTFEVVGRSNTNLKNVSLAFGLYDERMQRLCLIDSATHNNFYSCEKGAFRFQCNITNLPLAAGRYSLNLAIKENEQLIIAAERVAIIYIEENELTEAVSSHLSGPLLVDYKWQQISNSENVKTSSER